MVFKQIFRVAFVTLIWKQYKALIVSTFLIIAYVLLVGNVHSDYLTHSQLQKDTSASGISFIYKWAAYTAGILLYFGFHALRSKRPKKQDLADKAKQANKTAKHDPQDPFAAIREKDKLRSRADFIEQQPK
ncbi:MAG: threonine/homoserine/homoserine lactone efflux protein [Arenicella sp.]|jgi:hypothetical protein